jgi:V8-like Glu-specific endopeptidase
MTGPDARPEKGIRRENVYRCVRWVGGEKGESDWAVVQVDREIKAPQVTVRTAATPALAKGTGVTVIGYPIGLPLKVAGNAQVRDLDSKNFVANLDTYGGNSGSAVFNTERLAKGELLVEGILVSGAQDFLTLLNNTCYVSQQCSNAGCSGERVTRISEIAAARKSAK